MLLNVFGSGHYSNGPFRYLAPLSIQYPQKEYTLYIYDTVYPIKPILSQPVYNFTVEPSLPSSILFDTETGIISGYCLKIINETFTVTAHLNNQKKAATKITFMVSSKPILSENDLFNFRFDDVPNCPTMGRKYFIGTFPSTYTTSVNYYTSHFIVQTKQLSEISPLLKLKYKKENIKTIDIQINSNSLLKDNNIHIENDYNEIIMNIPTEYISYGRNEIKIIIKKEKPSNDNNLFTVLIQYNIEDYRKAILEYRKRVLDMGVNKIIDFGEFNQGYHRFILSGNYIFSYSMGNDYCAAVIGNDTFADGGMNGNDLATKYGVVLDTVSKSLYIKGVDRTGDNNVSVVIGVYNKTDGNCNNLPNNSTNIEDTFNFTFSMVCPPPSNLRINLQGENNKAYTNETFSYLIDVYFQGGTINKCPNYLNVTSEWFYDMGLNITGGVNYHLKGTPQKRDPNFNFTVYMYNADGRSEEVTVHFPIYYHKPKNMAYATDPVIMWYHYNYTDDTSNITLSVNVEKESEPKYEIVLNKDTLLNYGIYINESTGSLCGYPNQRTMMSGNVEQAIKFKVQGSNEGGSTVASYNVRVLYGPPKGLKIEPIYVYMELEEDIKPFYVNCYDCYILNYTRSNASESAIDSGLQFNDRLKGEGSEIDNLDPPYIDLSKFDKIYEKDRDNGLYLSNDTSVYLFTGEATNKGPYTYSIRACNDQGCSEAVEIEIEIICPIVKNFTYKGGYYETENDIDNDDYDIDFEDFEEIGKYYTYVFYNGTDVQPNFSPYPNLHLKDNTMRQCEYTYEIEDESILNDVGVDFNETDGKFYGIPFSITNITAYNITVYNEVGNGTLDQEYIWVVYPIPGKIIYNQLNFTLRVYLDWLDAYPIYVGDYVQKFSLRGNEKERIDFLNKRALDFSTETGRFWGLVNSSFSWETFGVYAENYRGNSSNTTTISIRAYCVEAQNLTYEALNDCNKDEILDGDNDKIDSFCFRTGYLKAYVGEYIGVFKPTFWCCDYIYLYCDKELELRKSGIFFNRLTGDFQGNVTQPFPEQVVHFYVFNSVEEGGENATGISIPFNLTVYFTYPPPSNLRYSPNPVTFYVNVTINPMIPTVDGVVYNYTIMNVKDFEENLEGLEFDNTTGIISGIPEEVTEEPFFLNITACNDEGCVYFVLNVTIDILRENTIMYLPKKYIFPINDYSEISKPSYYSQQSSLLKFEISDYDYLTSIGFIFNTTDGSIKGTPTILVEEHEFIVTGYFNDSDNPTDKIAIQVYDPYQFPVYIPESAVFDENTLHICLNYTHPKGLPIICRLYNNITLTKEWETVPQFIGLLDGQFYSIIMKNHSIFESNGYYYHGLVHNLLGAIIKDINFIIDTDGDENESVYLKEEQAVQTTDVGFIFSYASKSHFYSVLIKVEGDFYTNLTVENYALFVAHSYLSSFVKVMVESEGNVTINNLGSIGIVFCNGESISIKNSYIHMNIVEYKDPVYAGLFAGVCTYCLFLNSFIHVEKFNIYVIYYGDFYISGFVGVSDSSNFVNIISTIGEFTTADDLRFNGMVTNAMRELQNQVISELVGHSQSTKYLSCNTYSNYTEMNKYLKYGIGIGEDVKYKNNSISESYFKVYYNNNNNEINHLSIRSNITNTILYVKPDLEDYFNINKEGAGKEENKPVRENIYVLFNGDKEVNLTDYEGVKSIKFNESLDSKLFDGLDFSIFGYWSYVIPYEVIKSLEDIQNPTTYNDEIKYKKSVFQSRLPIRLENLNNSNNNNNSIFEYWPVPGNCYIVLDECWDAETWEVKTQNFPVLNRYRTDYHYEKPFGPFVDKYSTQCSPQCSKQQQCINYKCVCINGMKGLDCDIPFNQL